MCCDCAGSRFITMVNILLVWSKCSVMALPVHLVSQTTTDKNHCLRLVCSFGLKYLIVVNRYLYLKASLFIHLSSAIDDPNLILCARDERRVFSSLR